MKYDCSKTLDFFHEKKRLCDASDCDTCIIADPCGNGAIDAATISIVQNWSDKQQVNKSYIEYGNKVMNACRTGVNLINKFKEIDDGTRSAIINCIIAAEEDGLEAIIDGLEVARRFACIVVGNYRDKKGSVRDLMSLTTKAMLDGGCNYYNDAIFATPIGSAPIRAGRQFNAGRKLVKTHQYLLVYVKGDWKEATKRLGDVELPDLSKYLVE